LDCVYILEKAQPSVDIDGAGVAGPRFKRLKVAISRCCLLGKYWTRIQILRVVLTSCRMYTQLSIIDEHILNSFVNLERVVESPSTSC
jgi:hypothetical protein